MSLTQHFCKSRTNGKKFTPPQSPIIFDNSTLRPSEVGERTSFSTGVCRSHKFRPASLGSASENRRKFIFDRQVSMTAVSHSILRLNCRRLRSPGFTKLGHEMRYNWWIGWPHILSSNCVLMLPTKHTLTDNRSEVKVTRFVCSCPFMLSWLISYNWKRQVTDCWNLLHRFYIQRATRNFAVGGKVCSGDRVSK